MSKENAVGTRRPPHPARAVWEGLFLIDAANSPLVGAPQVAFGGKIPPLVAIGKKHACHNLQLYFRDV